MKVSIAVLFALLLAVAIFVEDCDAAGKKKRRRNRNRRRKNRHRIHPAPPQDCGPIPHLDHAQALQTPEGVHYACQPGFRLEGTNVITCIDGRWTVAPRCVRQVCPAPPHVAFANPPQLSTSGTSVTYTCQTGYRIVGGNGALSKTLVCSVALQQWPALPQCEQIPTQTCGAPPTVNLASTAVSGNVATYTCLTGYIRRSGTPSQITCVGTTWSYTTLPACDVDPSTTPPPPKCLKAPPCGGTTITRGNVADSYDVGNKVKYTCIDGYRIVGQNDNSKKEVEIECKSDGTWSTVPTCERVDCGQPSHAANGNTQVLAATATRFGDQYTYRCLDLYETSMATMATCGADGKWNIPPPVCNQKVCLYSALPTLTNGAAYGLTANVDIPVGTNVTYTCNANYGIAPVSNPSARTMLQQIQCLSNGSFSAFAYSCVYTYPTSCYDYYNRDNLFAAATIGSTVTVRIDTDGPTVTNVPTDVTCQKLSATQVCTLVAPSSGSTLSGAVATCTTTLTSIIPGVTFVPAGGAVDEATGVCDSISVAYPLSTAQLSSLLTNSQNCRQQISTTCSGTTAFTDSNFIAVLRNGDSEGVSYSAIGANIGTAGTTIAAADLPNLQSSPCDCHLTGACDGCHCSNPAAITSQTDFITLALTGTSPRYVTQIARVAGDTTAGAAATPGLTATELNVNVGNIECCQTFP